MHPFREWIRHVYLFYNYFNYNYCLHKEIYDSSEY